MALDPDLKNYDPSRYDRPSVAVDIVIFSVVEKDLKVLLIKRALAPFKDQWALPGGFVDKQKDVDLHQAALRELKEETAATPAYLEQLYTFGDNQRDPRDWTVSVCFFALMPFESVNLQAGSDSKEAKWWTVKQNQVTCKLAFDHAKIIKIAVERLRSKLEYTAIAGHLLGNQFTLPRLQEVYEIILNTSLDKTSFRRGLARANVVEETGNMVKGGHRPAKCYRFTKNAKNSLFFPRSIVRAAYE